jgi:hypothetical protein
MARVQEIQTVVENFRDQCNCEWRLEDELPEMIKQGFKDFETYIFSKQFDFLTKPAKTGAFWTSS